MLKSLLTRSYGTHVRIAHVAPRGESPGSGVLTVIVELAAALGRRGHSVDVWTLHEWESDLYRNQIGLLRTSGVNIVSLSGPLWKVAREARRAALERATELVHLHGAFNISNTVVSRAVSVPYVFSPHSGYDQRSLRRSYRRKRLFSRLFEYKTLSRAALVVALTPLEKTEVELYGVTRDIVIIPNGVSQLVHPRIDSSAFRDELHLAGSERLALFVGRLDVEHKGLDVFMEGISNAPRWHAALVGPDHRGGAQKLRRLVIDLGIRDRAHICGPRSGKQLDEVFLGADVFVLMSRWEGMPMSLLEALIRGVPAVVSEVVEDRVPVARNAAGWVSHPAGLGVLLQEIGQDDDARLAAGQAAERLARSYDWDVVAQSYETAYSMLVA